MSVSKKNCNTIQSPRLGPKYFVLPPSIDRRPHVHRNSERVLDLNPYLGHICIPCLLLRRPIANTTEWAQNMFTHTIRWVTEDLQRPLVPVVSDDVSMVLAPVQDSALSKKPPIVVTPFNRPEKVTKQAVREDNGLVLEGMILLVPTVDYALVVSRTTDSAEGAINKAPDRVERRTSITDRIGIRP